MLVSSMAIYNYDNNIFDNLVLPDGMERNTLINLILFETAELSILYSDPETFKMFLGVWSRSRLSVWQHLWDLANEEYDPLDNYNRTDTTTFEHGHTINMSKSDTRNSSESGSNSRSDTKNDYVYGFNSESRQAKDDTLVSGSGNYTQTGNYTDTETNAHTHGGTDVETKHGKGNIGVPTYGKMIKEELELRPQLDIYKYIVAEFKCEFCVMVY